MAMIWRTQSALSRSPRPARPTPPSETWRPRLSWWRPPHGRGTRAAAGIIAGLPLAAAAFRLLSADVHIEAHVRDGAIVNEGELLLTLTGPARAILAGERTALNFVGRLSGIATLTADYVRHTDGTALRICCTRKTTPGLRALEKYAVRCGGGFNHRFGLDDAILIKDNHFAVA